MINRNMWVYLGIVSTASILLLLNGRSSSAGERPGPPEATEAPRPANSMRMLADEPVALADTDTALQKLLKTRYNTALQIFKGVDQNVSKGNQPMPDLFTAATRVTEAELELRSNPQEEISALEELLELARHVEVVQEGRYQTGRLVFTEVLVSRYERLNVEIRLQRARQEAERASSGSRSESPWLSPRPSRPDHHAIGVAAASIEGRLFVFRMVDDGTVQRRLIHPDEYMTWEFEPHWVTLPMTDAPTAEEQRPE